MRRYFGTDGVRGVVGEDLTVELVERLAKAATLWSGRGRVFVGRDTRGSGPELEEAFGRGVAAAGGNAVLAGVLPTPACALLALDLGVVISASHNPYEDNGIKFFGADSFKLSDATELAIERRLAAGPAAVGSRIGRVRELHGVVQQAPERDRLDHGDSHSHSIGRFVPRLQAWEVRVASACRTRGAASHRRVRRTSRSGRETFRRKRCQSSAQ